MNPYGIQQVDVPGLLSVYQGAQQSRTQQMLAKKQAELADRQAERQSKFDQVLARGMGVYGQPSKGMGEVFGGQEAPAGSPATEAAPQRTDFRLPPETMAQLIALDADQASKIIGAFSKMDDAQHAASQRVNGTLGRAAQYLLGIPEAERMAEIQRIAPELVAEGIDPQQIAGFQPTTRNLEFMVAQSRDIEKLREEAMPKLRNVQAGDMIIDERRIGQPGSPTVYESPLVKGPDGAIYERVPGGQAPQSEAELRAAADEAIRQGADPAQVNARLQQMLGGGSGGNAGGNFP